MSENNPHDQTPRNRWEPDPHGSQESAEVLQVQPRPQPPPYQGYGDTLASSPADPADPAATSSERPPRRWPWALAGGLAGAVLAASVAVPIAVNADDDAAAGNDPAAAAAPDAAQDPDGDGFGGFDGEGFSPEDLPEGFPFDRFGRQGGTTGEAATDAQSRGVVLIETTVGEGTRTGTGAGTGMVLSARGLVLTNYHVVEDSSAVSVTVATTGEEYDGEVVGYDQTADVALVQLDVGDTELETVELDDDGTEIEEAVTAVGNAFGQGSLSVVTGSVLAEEESITAGDRGRSGGEELTGLLQTDAPVVSGYSGGPLFDAQGEVVGINTAASFGRSFASAETTGESYAVPIEDALAIVELIEEGDESGSVTIGPSAYLGISIASDAGGAVIADVEADGAAADAGLAAGDTITEVDGITIGSFDELVATLADYEPGDRVELGWTGPNGGRDSATATLGESPVN